MSSHYATITIVEKIGGTVELNDDANGRWVSMSDDEWETIVRDWAAHFAERDADPDWKHR